MWYIYMLRNILPILLCPECKSNELICKPFVLDKNDQAIDGVIYCKTCMHWYAIEGYILDFLPSNQEYSKDRYRFYNQHKVKMKLLKLSYREGERKVSPQKIQQKHFDWYANNSVQKYTEYAKSKFWEVIDARIFKKWNKYINEGGLLLDIGCGQGRSTFPFANKSIQIVAFDISKNMILEAQKQYSKSKTKADIVFMVADAASIPLKSGVFDFIITYGVLHHLPNPKKTASEILRILQKNNGMVFGLENNKSSLRIFFDMVQKIKPL